MGNRTERRCVRCERDSGYNREVIDLVRDVAIGSLCRRCELAAFDSDAGVAASGNPDADGHGCVSCDRDGFYALPRWLPETRRVGGDLVSHVDYERDRDPPALCDEHYHELAGRPPATAVETPPRRERR